MNIYAEDNYCKIYKSFYELERTFTFDEIEADKICKELNEKGLKNMKKNIVTDNDFLDMLESIRNRCISVGCGDCSYNAESDCPLFEDFPEHWNIDKRNNKIEIIDD